MKNTEVKERQAELLTKVNKLKENKKDSLEVLGYQHYHSKEYIDALDAITKTEFNQEQLSMGGIFSVLMDSFNLGVIIGKRMERAKGKNQNSRSLLLEQISILKLENLRLRTVLEKLDKDFDQTIKICKSQR